MCINLLFIHNLICRSYINKTTMNYKSNPKIIEKNHTFDNIFQYTKIPTVQISLNKQDMDNIRNLIIKTIGNIGDKFMIQEIRKEVLDLASKFPIYKI